MLIGLCFDWGTSIMGTPFSFNIFVMRQQNGWQFLEAVLSVVLTKMWKIWEHTSISSSVIKSWRNRAQPRNRDWWCYKKFSTPKLVHMVRLKEMMDDVQLIRHWVSSSIHTKVSSSVHTKLEGQAHYILNIPGLFLFPCQGYEFLLHLVVLKDNPERYNFLSSYGSYLRVLQTLQRLER